MSLDSHTPNVTGLSNRMSLDPHPHVWPACNEPVSTASLACTALLWPAFAQFDYLNHAPAVNWALCWWLGLRLCPNWDWDWGTANTWQVLCWGQVPHVRVMWAVGASGSRLWWLMHDGLEGMACMIVTSGFWVFRCFACAGVHMVTAPIV